MPNKVCATQPEQQRISTHVLRLSVETATHSYRSLRLT